MHRKSWTLQYILYSIAITNYKLDKKIVHLVLVCCHLVYTLYMIHVKFVYVHEQACMHEFQNMEKWQYMWLCFIVILTISNVHDPNFKIWHFLSYLSNNVLTISWWWKESTCLVFGEKRHMLSHTIQEHVFQERWLQHGHKLELHRYHLVWYRYESIITFLSYYTKTSNQNLILMCHCCLFLTT